MIGLFSRFTSWALTATGAKSGNPSCPGRRQCFTDQASDTPTRSAALAWSRSILSLIRPGLGWPSNRRGPLSPTGRANPAGCWRVGWRGCGPILHRERLTLRRATREFLLRSFDEPPARDPAWLPDALGLIDETPSITTAQIARALDLNPGWLAERYRSAVGEGIGETVRRRRVEIAVQMLASSSEPQAQVAAAAGFCDQSHMIRAFREVLGRTPGEIRSERMGKRAN